MKRVLISSIVSLGIFAATPALTQEPPPTFTGTDACREAINRKLAKEQRIYRHVLFGRRRTGDEPVASVRFDTLGQAWYKQGRNAWRLVNDEQGASLVGDSSMEADSEVDSIPLELGGVELPRRGIFETKRVLTSDLIPYLTQSYRALQCRINTIDSLVQTSLRLPFGDEPQDINVNVRGCIPVTLQSIEECHMAEAAGQDSISSIAGYATNAGNALLQREEHMLKMLVEYDASYRSLLQFAGIFDEFLNELRWTLTGNLRRAVSSIGWLDDIPCFMSSCEESSDPPSS